jgi:hypothetical protein
MAIWQCEFGKEINRIPREDWTLLRVVPKTKAHAAGILL